MTDLKDLTTAQLQDLAADLSAEVGGEVKPSATAIRAALAKLPDSAKWLAARVAGEAAAPTADVAQDNAPDAAAAPSSAPPQRVEGIDPTEQLPRVSKPPQRPADKAERFAHLPPETKCLKLVGGPNQALMMLEIRSGDIIVSPSEEVAREFRRGVQHAKLSLAEARQHVAAGYGRFSKKHSPAELADGEAA